MLLSFAYVMRHVRLLVDLGLICEHSYIVAADDLNFGWFRFIKRTLSTDPRLCEQLLQLHV